MQTSRNTLASPLHAPLGFREFVCMVAALMGLNAVSIDIMLPALGEIGRELGVASENDRQIVLSAYLVGFGIGQLFIGPISDRFGRKPVLMVGLGFYVLTSLACALAPSFEVLLLARVLQGFSSAVPRVITTSVVRDCYTGSQMARVMSLTMIVFMAVPVVAPSLGQLFTLFGSWRYIFGFITFFSASVFAWSALRLPETSDPQNRRSLDFSTVIKAIMEVLRTRQSFGYMLAAGTMFGALFGFLNSAQQIYDEVFGVGKYFPLIFAAIAASISFSSFINSRLVHRLGMRFIVHGALVVFTALTAIMLLLEQLGLLSLLPFVLLLGSSMFLVGMLFANLNALAMEPQGHIAGTASSVIGSFSTIIAATCGFYIGSMFNGTLLPISLGFVILGASSLLIVAWTERGKLFSR